MSSFAAPKKDTDENDDTNGASSSSSSQAQQAKQVPPSQYMLFLTSDVLRALNRKKYVDLVMSLRRKILSDAYGDIFSKEALDKGVDQSILDSLVQDMKSIVGAYDKCEKDIKEVERAGREFAKHL